MIDRYWKFCLFLLILATVVFVCALNIASNTMDARERIQNHNPELIDGSWYEDQPGYVDIP